MSDILINQATGDSVRENGSFVRVTGLAEIAQRVYQALLLVRGEWFFDQTIGFPYMTKFFGRNKPSSTEVNSIVEIEVLSVEGVTGLRAPIEYELNNTNGVASIAVDLTTTEGNLTQTFSV